MKTSKNVPPILTGAVLCAAKAVIVTGAAGPLIDSGSLDSGGRVSGTDRRAREGDPVEGTTADQSSGLLDQILSPEHDGSTRTGKSCAQTQCREGKKRQNQFYHAAHKRPPLLASQPAADKQCVFCSQASHWRE
jgi:hypothetical protein